LCWLAPLLWLAARVTSSYAILPRTAVSILVVVTGLWFSVTVDHRGQADLILALTRLALFVGAAAL
jgi:hypothetical protein